MSYLYLHLHLCLPLYLYLYSCFCFYAHSLIIYIILFDFLFLYLLLVSTQKIYSSFFYSTNTIISYFILNFYFIFIFIRLVTDKLFKSADFVMRKQYIKLAESVKTNGGQVSGLSVCLFVCHYCNLCRPFFMYIFTFSLVYFSIYLFYSCVFKITILQRIKFNFVFLLLIISVSLLLLGAYIFISACQRTTTRSLYRSRSRITISTSRYRCVSYHDTITACLPAFLLSYFILFTYIELLDLYRRTFIFFSCFY